MQAVGYILGGLYYSLFGEEDASLKASPPKESKKKAEKLDISLKDKLDPITVLVVSALLKFKEKGSRITYSNSLEVFIQQPKDYDYGVPYVLSAVRTVKRQSHSDAGIIQTAISKAAKWHQPHTPEKADYKTLFEWAKKGLTVLKKTYEDEQQDFIAGGVNDLIKSIDNLISKSVEASEPLSGTMKRIAELWSLHDIQRVNGLFQQMAELQGDTPISKQIKCLNEIRQVEFIVQQKLKLLTEIWTIAT